MTLLRKTKELPFFPLYEKFISDSKTGRRLQPNGKRIGARSIGNYNYPLNLLKDFSEREHFTLRFRPIHYLNKREMQTEKKYWKKFHLRFTDYLYNSCGHFDNYVGQTLKVIRTFFNYLNKELMLGIGDFHKFFYVWREEVPVITLLPEELNFLIYDFPFHESLSNKLKIAKDVFVFGCTVALRFSDLMGLKKSNIRTVNDNWYLVVRSQKTATDTLIKLPDYAVGILKKYECRSNKLLPQYHLSVLNDSIKIICKRAGFDQPVNKIRSMRGKLVQIKSAKNNRHSNSGFRFYDLVSSHTMRRTAITTMLCLGVPEQLVRKISGHSPISKEFFRYIALAQAYQNNELGKMFEILKDRKLVN